MEYEDDTLQMSHFDNEHDKIHREDQVYASHSQIDIYYLSIRTCVLNELII